MFWYSRSSNTARDFLKPVVLTLARLCEVTSSCVCCAADAGRGARVRRHQHRAAQAGRGRGQCHRVATETVTHGEQRQSGKTRGGPARDRKRVVLDPVGHGDIEATQAGGARAARAAIIVGDGVEAKVGQVACKRFVVALVS